MQSFASKKGTYCQQIPKSSRKLGFLFHINNIFIEKYNYSKFNHQMFFLEPLSTKMSKIPMATPK